MQPGLGGEDGGRRDGKIAHATNGCQSRGCPAKRFASLREAETTDQDFGLGQSAIHRRNEALVATSQ
jgi:hypothetical protein